MKIFKEGGINFTHYNLESENGGAISMRLHNQRDSALQKKLNKMGAVEGKSCPVPWVSYVGVKDKLREHEFGEFESEPIIKEIGAERFDLACPCNTK